MPKLAKPVKPSVNIVSSLILGNSITLLNFAFELITATVNGSGMTTEKYRGCQRRAHFAGGQR